MLGYNGDRELSECARLCESCAQECFRVATHCLHRGGESAGPEHQTALHDCADLCEATAHLAARSSRHCGDLGRVCAEACEACAERCESLADGDPLLMRCALSCRRAADWCNWIAGAAVAAAK